MAPIPLKYSFLHVALSYMEEIKLTHFYLINSVGYKFDFLQVAIRLLSQIITIKFQRVSNITLP